MMKTKYSNKCTMHGSLAYPKSPAMYETRSNEKPSETMMDKALYSKGKQTEATYAKSVKDSNPKNDLSLLTNYQNPSASTFPDAGKKV